MLRLPLGSLAAGLAAAWLFNFQAPTSYVASARVLLAEGAGGSRIVKLEHAALDPAEAQARLQGALRSYSGSEFVDPPTLVPAARSLATDLGIGALLGLGFGAGVTAWQARRRRPVRGERDIALLLGNPLLGARPHRPEAVRALAQQLQRHWLSGERKVLPVISAGSGDGRSSLARALALQFAALGERTLLIDADFRAPAQHRAFALDNSGGLADLLDGRDVKLAVIGENARSNLAVLVAGAARADPLELLSRPRLLNFLQAASRPFGVVLIDTPAAERGPDYELFAALARGALLVIRAGEDAKRIVALRRRLAHCAARPVATVITHR